MTPIKGSKHFQVKRKGTGVFDVHGDEIRVGDIVEQRFGSYIPCYAGTITENSSLNTQNRFSLGTVQLYTSNTSFQYEIIGVDKRIK